MNDLDVILDWLRNEGDRLGVPDSSIERRMSLGHGAASAEVVRVLRVARRRAQLLKRAVPRELIAWLAHVEGLGTATHEGQSAVSPLIHRYWARRGKEVES